MLDSKTFESLEPRIRAYALVGAYLQYWALMESQINRTIIKSLSLTNMQGVLVTRNIQLRDKIHMTKAILHLEVFDAKDRELYIKLMRRIADLSTDRNTVAHDMFDYDEQGDGVIFFVARAKGKIEFPDTRWNIATFSEKAEELFKIHGKLKELGDLVVRLKVARELNMTSTNAMRSGLGLLGFPPPHSRDNLDSSFLSAIAETGVQIPPTSEE